MFFWLQLNFTKRFFSSCQCFFKQYQTNKTQPFNKIPGPSPSLPFLGTSWQFSKFLGKYDLNKIHEANKDKYCRFGSIIKEEAKWRTHIIQIFEPNDFQKVLRAQGECPFRPPNEFVCHFRKKNSSKYPNVGLSNLNGDEWLRQRQLLAPVLLTLNAYNILPKLNQIDDELFSYLERQCDESNIINHLHQVTYQFALESMSIICLNKRINCLSSSPSIDGQGLILATQNLFEAFHELYFGSSLWKIFPTKSYQKYIQAELFIYNTIWNYIQDGLQKLTLCENQDQTKSLLKTLLNIKGLNEKDVIILVMDFIIGGINTLATSLCFLFYYLASTPHVQDKLFKQIKSVIKSKEGEIVKNHLDYLPYLKACVKESFRLASIIPSLVRVLPQSIILSGYEVPAGIPIIINMNVASKLSSNFEEPEKFKPERWLNANKTKIHPFSVLPFGFGVRMCVGRRISELILYFITTKVLLYYELEAITKELNVRQNFIIIPSNPIQIKFKKRV